METAGKTGLSKRDDSHGLELLGMNPTIEIRERCSGDVLVRMPLYDFLAQLHTRLPAADEYAFEDLRILLNDHDLLPEPGGHA